MKQIEIDRQAYLKFRQDYRDGRLGGLALAQAFTKQFGQAFCDRKDLNDAFKNCKDDELAQKLVGRHFRMV